MTKRQKLSREHLALLVHNMRLKYGMIIRERDASFTALHSDTCIDCGWAIEAGQYVTRAYWTNREVRGFYAHTPTCSPIDDSEWLKNREYDDVFSSSILYMNQSCRIHHVQVIYRVLFDDHLEYVCAFCVLGDVSESNGHVVNAHSRSK